MTSDCAYARDRIRRIAAELLDWLRGCDFRIDAFDLQPFLNRVRGLRHYAAGAGLDGEAGEHLQSYIERTADMLEQGQYMPAASRLSNIVKRFS